MKHLLIALLVLTLGCTKPSAQTKKAQYDLMSIALQYHQYVSYEKSPPADAEALANFKGPVSALPGDQASAAASINALKSGDYIVNWSFDVAADTTQNPIVILAYHKDVPIEGGFVAFANGQVRNLSKEEFASTVQATGN